MISKIKTVPLAIAFAVWAFLCIVSGNADLIFEDTSKE
jgi:hypothetical protein